MQVCLRLTGFCIHSRTHPSIYSLMICDSLIMSVFLLMMSIFFSLMMRVFFVYDMGYFSLIRRAAAVLCYYVYNFLTYGVQETHLWGLEIYTNDMGSFSRLISIFSFAFATSAFIGSTKYRLSYAKNIAYHKRINWRVSPGMNAKSCKSKTNVHNG